MFIKPTFAVTDGRVAPRNTSNPVRQKRMSIKSDSNYRKRRKFETPESPNSPSQSISHVKQIKHNVSTFTIPGMVLFFGVGDTGQLGLGPDVTERSRPARPSVESINALQITEEKSLTHFTQICCGGMHSVCLTVCGRVATCGCNDEGALGRPTNSEARATDSTDNGSYPIVDECHLGLVPFPTKVEIVMVSAGDSHTAALDSNGQVWLWGTFRGSSGPIGLTQPGEICATPRPLLAHPMNGSAEGYESSSGSDYKRAPRFTNSALLSPSARVIKIASGQDHLVCLTDEGRLYTMGCAEQGQLGRVAERFAKDGGRSGISSLLQPTECRVRGAVRFSDVWAGGFATFARCQMTGAVYACGLNNYGQLALRDTTGHGRSLNPNLTEESVEIELSMAEDAARLVNDSQEADRSEAQLIARQGPLIQFMLTRAFGFDPEQKWQQFAIGMHHTLALNNLGHVYTVGRPDYGRLGLGCDLSSSKVSVSKPTRVRGPLGYCVCSLVGCGEACSFAVDQNGNGYSWGMGSNHQLGHGSGDDDCWEPELIVGKQLENRRILMVDAGGQHTLILACPTVPPGKLSLDVDVLMHNTSQHSNGTNNSPIVNNHNCEAQKLDSIPSSGHTVEPQQQEEQQDVELSPKAMKLSDASADTSSERILIPPIGSGAPQSKRNRRSSPSSIAGSTGTTLLTPMGLSCDSTTGSTAGATFNSSVHSSAVSDTCSVGSCASTSSTSSQLNSAKSTDGGGSSRYSSFDNYSLQSSLLFLPSGEEKSLKDA